MREKHMDFISDHSDSRLKEYCVFCNILLTKSNSSKDHAPSKVFLNKPYPENLFLISACKKCNNSFSKDEEYIAAILSVQMSNSTDPDKQIFEKGGQILSQHSKLQQKIIRESMFDERGRFYGVKFEENRLANVMIKNAKALALYMASSARYNQPSHFNWSFLPQLTADERANFEIMPDQLMFPEVGSRALTLLVMSNESNLGWQVIQENIFRFAITENVSTIIRMIFCEFLFVEVVWEE